MCEVAERLGSGDGERKTLLTRQIAFEPLPASVLFALVWPMVVLMVSGRGSDSTNVATVGSRNAKECRGKMGAASL